MTESIKAKFKVENEKNRIGIIDEVDIDYICSIGTEQQIRELTFTLKEPIKDESVQSNGSKFGFKRKTISVFDEYIHKEMVKLENKSQILNEIHEAIEKGIIELEDAKGVICSVKIHKDTFDFDFLDTISNTLRKNIKKSTLFAFQSELIDEVSFEGKIELSLLVVTGGGNYAIKQNNTIVSFFSTPKEAYQKAEQLHTETGLFYEVVSLV